MFRLFYQPHFSTNLFSVTDKVNTTFNLDEIPQKDFKAHMQRILDYLVCGKDVWWTHNRITNDITFFDGTSEPDFRPQVPTLKDFTKYSTPHIVSEVTEL